MGSQQVATATHGADQPWWFFGVAQTLTQLHEPVVGLVPRLIAVVLVVLAALPWLLGRWSMFAVRLIESIPDRL